MSTSMRKEDANDWIKLDLHIHTFDDPKDKLDYSAHELLARARRLGFSVLAITLHDAVFDRPEVFAAAQWLKTLANRWLQLPMRIGLAPLAVIIPSYHGRRR